MSNRKNKHLNTVTANDDDRVIPLQYAVGSPWRRLIARGIDYCVYFLIAFLCWVLIYSLDLVFHFPKLPMFLSAFFCLGICGFIWIYIEAFFLSVFDMTPGKWLMFLRLRNARKQKLTFHQAVSRASFIVMASMWWNDKPVSYYYRKFDNLETVSWDERGKFTVEYHPFRWHRCIITGSIMMFLWVICILVMVYLFRR